MNAASSSSPGWAGTLSRSRVAVGSDCPGQSPASQRQDITEKISKQRKKGEGRRRKKKRR